jgi:hypothetical protein
MSDAMPDPSQSPAYKAAKLAVIILSALIILALIALVAGAILKFQGGGRTLATPPGGKFILPAGAKILSSDSQPGRLILHVQTGAGEEIDILDTSDGHLVNQIKAGP